MPETLTVRDFIVDSEDPVPASGRWEYTPQPVPQVESTLRRAVTQTVKHAGVAALLAISSVTVGVDPWIVDRRQRHLMSLEGTFEAILGRPISAREARNMALQILARAEERRNRFAEDEAKRGFDLEPVL